MWKLLAVLLAAEFTSTFELSMLFSGMKALIEVFKSPVRVGWLFTSFLLVSSAAAAICGRLGDLYGRRRLLLVVLALAAIGSAISATGSSLEQVIIGRGLQGFAGAILPLCYGLLREQLPSKNIAYATGILAASIVVAAAAGLLTGGALVQHFAWNSLFIVSGAMAAISFLLCWAILPPSRPQPPQGPIDLLGGLLFAPGICMLLIAVSYGADWGWANPRSTLPLLFGGLLVLVLWGWHELRTANPLIDLRLLARPRVALANVAMCGYSLGVQGQVLFLLLQQPVATGVGFGIKPAMAGLIAIPAQFMGLVAAQPIASASSRFGSQPILIVSGLILTMAMAAQLASLLLPHYLWLALSLGLVAVGSVAMFAAVPNIIIANVPPDRTSEATGVMQVNRSIVQAVSAQIAATLLATGAVFDPVTGAGPFPSYSAYLLTIGVATILSLSTLFAALFLSKMTRSSAANNTTS
jgi:MFS family permease